MTMTTLSLIIPIYNEARHLQEFLAVIDLIHLPVRKQLVIVNDCSTDESADVINRFPFQSEAVVINHAQNRGKGAAIRTGIKHATGELICIQDADFEYDARDIRRLLRPLLQHKADVVYGSRYKKNCTNVHRTFHYLANRFLTLLSNVMSGLYLSDMETCYKVFRADVLKNIQLKTDRFGFEPEVTAKIARLRLRVAEVPISYYPRNYEEGKKITWKDGVAAIWHIFYFNLSGRRRECFLPALPANYLPRAQHWL
jgi:glycosyltransferase involved in cell wall biosynthesis